MPRSKPQDTRRRLNSAYRHLEIARSLVVATLPVDVDYNEWDERYKALGCMVAAMSEMLATFKLILGNKGGGQDLEES